MPTTLTLTPVYDAAMLEAATNTWNGGCQHLPLGFGTSYKYRSCVKFTVNLKNWISVTSATLRLRNDGTSYHGTQSGTRHVIVNRMTRDWNESGNWRGETFSSGDYTWANRSIGYITTNQATSAPITGTVNGNVDIDVTGIVRDWLSGLANYGFLLRSDNEAGAYLEFKSRHYDGGNHQALLIITGEYNQSPAAPINLSPTGGETVANPAKFYGEFSDPDIGDLISKVTVDVLTSAGATDPIWTTTVEGDPWRNNFTVTGPTLNGGTTYYWRARTSDIHGAWGPNCAVQSFKVNNAPPMPTSLQPSSTSTSLTPSFTGYSDDPDVGDYLTRARIWLYDSSGAQLWYVEGNSDLSTFNIPYSGPALSQGTTYVWGASVKDANGAWSAVAWEDFTTYAVGLPYALSPVRTKLNTTSVTFTGTTPTVGDQFQIKVYDGATCIYDSTATAMTGTSFSVARTMPSYGKRYFWQAQYREASSGIWSGFTPQYPFYVNSSPTATLQTPANNAVVTSVTPTFYVTFNDPDKSLGFADVPTKFEVELSRVSDSVVMQSMARTASLVPGVNSATRWSYNISTINTGNPTKITTATAHGWATGQSVTVVGVTGNTPALSGPYTITVLNATQFTIAVNTTVAGTGGTVGEGTALTNDTQYRWRARFTDNSGATNALGPWSGYYVFKPTAAPTITSFAVAAADLTGSDINKPTALLQWAATYSGTKAQAYYRLVVMDAGNNNAVLLDTGTVLSTATSYRLTSGLLKNNKSYAFKLTLTDGDGLTAISSFTASTSWTPPPALSNFGATALDEQGYITLTWDQSTLNPTSEFDHYTVYRRLATEDAWTTLATYTNPAVVGYKDYAAPVGVAFDYVVTQWKKVPGDLPVESDNDAEHRTVLDADTWYLTIVNRDDLSLDINVDEEDHKSPFQMETFEPYGRTRKIVVRSGILGREGNIKVTVPQDQLATDLPKIRAILALNSATIYLKNPFGDVHKVFLDAPDERYLPGGHLELTMPYLEVA